MKVWKVSLVAIVLLVIFVACGYPPQSAPEDSSEDGSLFSRGNSIVLEGKDYIYISVPLSLIGLPVEEKNARVIGKNLLFYLEKYPDCSLVSDQVYWRPKSYGDLANRIYGLRIILKRNN